MKIIDLSHPIEEGVPTYLGGIEPVFTPRSTFATKGRMSSAISLGIHTATHLDAPLHFIPDGVNVAELPLEKVIGMATLLDVSGLERRSRFIDPAAFFETARDFPPGDIAVIYTGFDKEFGKPAFSTDYPCLALKSVQLLLGYHLKALAIDTVSVDPLDQPGFENHKALLGAGVPLVECLNGAAAIGQKRFFFAAFPLKLAGLEGSPCRAIAISDWVIP